MNQNRHRVVFNAARGMRMVVAESARSARSMGKATGVATVTAMLSLLVLTAALSPVQAQIVADPKAPGNGGAWKEAGSVKDLSSKATRRGTFNADLGTKVGP